MSNRDELASIIGSQFEHPANPNCHVCADTNRAAEEVLAAGYRKPRTITTAEELDALPVGGIIRGKWLAEKWADEEGELWYVAGKGIRWDTEQLVQRGGLPAEVLKEDLS